MTNPMFAPSGQIREVSGFEEFRVDGDMLFARAIGATTLEDVKRMFAINQGLYERYGYALVLIDGARASTTTPDARKYQSDLLRKRIFPSHTAIFGGGVLVRTTISLMMRATELLTGTKIPVDMVADEQTARTVLAAARERFAIQGIAKQPLDSIKQIK